MLKTRLRELFSYQDGETLGQVEQVFQRMLTATLCSYGWCHCGVYCSALYPFWTSLGDPPGRVGIVLSELDLAPAANIRPYVDWWRCCFPPMRLACL